VGAEEKKATPGGGGSRRCGVLVGWGLGGPVGDLQQASAATERGRQPQKDLQVGKHNARKERSGYEEEKHDKKGPCLFARIPVVRKGLQKGARKKKKTEEANRRKESPSSSIKDCGNAKQRGGRKGTR